MCDPCAILSYKMMSVSQIDVIHLNQTKIDGTAWKVFLTDNIANLHEYPSTIFFLLFLCVVLLSV